MDLDLLELIYYEYTDYCCENSETKEEPEGVKAFSEKYINPLLEQNSEEGIEMEAMFSRALADYDIRAFKTGFKACMNLIISSLVKDNFSNNFLDHFSEEEAET